MGQDLIGEESINFDYIIEVEGYERPLLLLQFTLNAYMTMFYKTSGKASTWDHIFDTRRCTIWEEHDFYNEVKITTLFGGKKPQIQYKGKLAMPILDASRNLALEGMLTEAAATYTNLFNHEKGQCGSSHGKNRRKKAKEIYKNAFDKAVNDSVERVIDQLGDEAASEIRNQIGNNRTGEKIVVKKVIPRALPNHKNVSKNVIAEQIYKSITERNPSEEELSTLLEQPNTKAMTKFSSDLRVAEYLEKMSQIEDFFEPLNLHAKKVTKLIEQGGERRAPKIEPVLGKDPEWHRMSQQFSDLLNSVTCIVTPAGGSMSSHYFPDNIDLSRQLENEFVAYNQIRIQITKWLDEGRNLARLLNVLHQDPSSLEAILDEIDDKMESSSVAVGTYVRFKFELARCYSHPNLTGRPIEIPELRRSDILKLINDTRELVFPPLQLDDLNNNDPKLFDDFEDYLAADIELEELNDISIQDFLKSVPSLKQLDNNKRDIIKGEIGLIRSNKMFDLDIRDSAFKIEEKMSKVLDAGQLEKVDLEILNLANKISATL